MKPEKAKVGMQVYCTEGGMEGTITDTDIFDNGCLVSFKEYKYKLFMEYEQIEEL